MIPIKAVTPQEHAWPLLSLLLLLFWLLLWRGGFVVVVIVVGVVVVVVFVVVVVVVVAVVAVVVDDDDGIVGCCLLNYSTCKTRGLTDTSVASPWFLLSDFVWNTPEILWTRVLLLGARIG